MTMIMDQMKMEKTIVKVLIGMSLIGELMKMIKRLLRRDNNRIKSKGIKLIKANKIKEISHLMDKEEDDNYKYF